MEQELKPRQKAAAELMALQPHLSFADIRRQLNIGEKTFWEWRKKPEFMNYYHSLCENRFKELEALAVAKLEENINNNCQKAIEYVLDYQGFAPTQKIDAKLNTDIQINISE